MEGSTQALKSSAQAPPADEPPKELIFHRRIHPVVAVRELYRARALLRTLAERDIRVRYKQTVLGLAWAVLSPVLLMVVFIAAFSHGLHVNTDGMPYPLFSYLGLLPWTFFSTSVSVGGQSLVANIALLNKIYCPREVFPLAAVLVGIVDTTIATLVLGILFAQSGTAPAATSVWIPVLFLIQFTFTVGVVLFISIMLVYFRDLRQIVPIILQAGLFVTPVAYGLQVIPAHLRPLYSALNPLGPVIDGYRRAILLGHNPQLGLLGIAAISAVAWLVVGYLIFKRMETRVADVA